MSTTNAALLNDRRESAYVHVLTHGAHRARSAEGESGYWASLGAKLVAAVVIGLAVLAILAIA
jgi:hypothetical protein